MKQEQAGKTILQFSLWKNNGWWTILLLRQEYDYGLSTAPAELQGLTTSLQLTLSRTKGKNRETSGSTLGMGGEERRLKNIY